MQLRNDADEIKELLKSRILDLCIKLEFCRCKMCGRQGNEFVVHNPFQSEAQKTPALKIALTGNKGAWRDWRNGDKGDILKLIEFRNSYTFKEALIWARDFLGLQEMSSQQRLALRRDVELRKQREDVEDRERRARKLEGAQALFMEDTVAYGLGSGAELHARAYFAARGCALEDIQNINPHTFRFSPGTEWWRGAEFKSANGGNRKVSSGPLYPAIHSAMRSVSGALTCCHVTFLDPTRPAKAPVEPPKLMRGEALGSVIEIAMGPEAKPFWLATEPHDVIIAEGVETCTSLAIPVPEARVWAAGSLAGLGHAPVQLSCVKRIFVARDNNEGNPQARKQLNDALVRLEEAGKPLVVMNSHVGDDFNNLIQGE
jgi:hypothetical protein